MKFLAPRHPQHNCYVECFNRSDKEEAIMIDLPQTLEEAQVTNETYAYHYNQQRPHQGLSCGNQPPLLAFPDLPTRPALPEVVHPLKWLDTYD